MIKFMLRIKSVSDFCTIFFLSAMTNLNTLSHKMVKFLLILLTLHMIFSYYEIYSLVGADYASYLNQFLGLGAAWKVADISEGSTVAIFGLGTVGLSVS